jgi:hypothetical protein
LIKELHVLLKCVVGEFAMFLVQFCSTLNVVVRFVLLEFYGQLIEHPSVMNPGRAQLLLIKLRFGGRFERVELISKMTQFRFSGVAIPVQLVKL